MATSTGKHSFRTAILALVLGSLSLTVGVIGVVAFVNSYRSVDELRERQYELTSRLMAKEVSRLLAVAPKLLHAQAGLARRGTLDLRDFDHLGEVFAETLRVEPELSWLSYGSADTGEYIGARRDEQGRIILNRSNPAVDGGHPREFLVGADGALTPMDHRQLPAYDARTRPWFQHATQYREAVWSRLYRWNDGTYGLTLSLAVRSAATGEVLGAFTADYTLTAMGEFLKSLAEGRSGRVLVLVAPDGQQMGSATTMHGTEAVSATLAALPMPLTQFRLDVPVGFRYDYEGHPMIGVARRIEPSPGFACVAVFAADEQEFFGSVMNNARSTATLGLAALFTAAAISFLLAARLTRPLVVISEDLKRIARFELQKSSPLPSVVQEIADVGENVERMKAGLRSFGRYVPTSLVRNLLLQGQEAELGAVQRELTVLFADLWGFTALSEKLTPSQTVVEMSEFFKVATDAIEGHEGTLDKFLGDGLLAFFNAPLDVPDHAYKACVAALRIRDQLAATEAARTAAGRPLLRARFGLNTGEVFVGNIGIEDRFAYTVIGDGANLASRLESLNKQYGTDILASETVREQTGDRFIWRQIDRVAVVGRAGPTNIYELLGTPDQVSPEQLALRNSYESAMEFYYTGNFAEALSRLNLLRARRPDDVPTSVLATRCEGLKVDPPKSWNGVFVADRK